MAGAAGLVQCHVDQCGIGDRADAMGLKLAARLGDHVHCNRGLASSLDLGIAADQVTDRDRGKKTKLFYGDCRNPSLGLAESENAAGNIHLDISQPPKISPKALVSAGIATTR